MLVKDYIKVRFLEYWISEPKTWAIESLVEKLILNNFFPVEKYCRNSMSCSHSVVDFEECLISS